MRKFALAIAAASLSLSSCTGLGALMSGTPPTSAALQATSIDEAAIDLVRDLFDVSLFGVDALTDLGRIVPGSPQARSLARLIRQIAGFLGAADSAQKAGQAATYNEALTNARNALRQFRAAIGMPADGPVSALPDHLTPDATRDLAVLLDSGSNLPTRTYAAMADRLGGSARGASN